MVVCVMVSSVSCGKCVHDVGALCCLSMFRVALVVSRVSLVVAFKTKVIFAQNVSRRPVLSWNNPACLYFSRSAIQLAGNDLCLGACLQEIFEFLSIIARTLNPVNSPLCSLWVAHNFRIPR